MQLQRSWIETPSIRVNPSKTETLHIGIGNQKITYAVNDTIQSCKDLGFFISNIISFSKHYSVIIRSSSFRMRQIEIKLCIMRQIF